MEPRNINQESGIAPEQARNAPKAPPQFFLSLVGTIIFASFAVFRGLRTIDDKKAAHAVSKSGSDAAPTHVCYEEAITGWTGTVANLIRSFGSLRAADVLAGAAICVNPKR